MNKKKVKYDEPYELFGIECGDGWKEIIQPILDYVDNYNIDKSEEERITISQIKEKFGTLRVYVNNGTEELREIIRNAEHESSITCEFCGSKENIGHTLGWITTCCEKCIKQLADSNKRTYKWVDNNTSNGEINTYELKPNQEKILISKHKL